MAVLIPAADVTLAAARDGIRAAGGTPVLRVLARADCAAEARGAIPAPGDWAAEQVRGGQEQHGAWQPVLERGDRARDAIRARDDSAVVQDGRGRDGRWGPTRNPVRVGLGRDGARRRVQARGGRALGARRERELGGNLQDEEREWCVHRSRGDSPPPFADGRGFGWRTGRDSALPFARRCAARAGERCGARCEPQPARVWGDNSGRHCRR